MSTVEAEWVGHAIYSFVSMKTKQKKRKTVHKVTVIQLVTHIPINKPIYKMYLEWISKSCGFWVKKLEIAL